MRAYYTYFARVNCRNLLRPSARLLLQDLVDQWNKKGALEKCSNPMLLRPDVCMFHVKKHLLGQS